MNNMTEHNFQCEIFTVNMNSGFLENVLFKLDCRLWLCKILTSGYEKNVWNFVVVVFVTHDFN